MALPHPGEATTPPPRRAKQNRDFLQNRGFQPNFFSPEHTATARGAGAGGGGCPTHTQPPRDSAPPVPERVGPAPRPGPSGAHDGERMA